MKIVNTDYSMSELRREIEKGQFTSCLIKHSKHNKDITFLLVEKNIKFTRINYGAGVCKLIINEGSVCEACHGEGVI